MEDFEEVAPFSESGDPETPFDDSAYETEMVTGSEEDEDEELDSPFEGDMVGPRQETGGDSINPIPAPVETRDELVGTESAQLDVTAEPVIEQADGVTALACGMRFADSDAIYDFYRIYASRKGFPIRKRGSRKGEDGELRYVAFECSTSSKRESTVKNPF